MEQVSPRQLYDSRGDTSMCVEYSPPEKKTIELAKQPIHQSSRHKAYKKVLLRESARAVTCPSITYPRDVGEYPILYWTGGTPSSSGWGGVPPLPVLSWMGGYPILSWPGYNPPPPRKKPGNSGSIMGWRWRTPGNVL